MADSTSTPSGLREALLVLADPQLGPVALAALTHPSLHGVALAREEEIVAALTQQRFEVAVVGGQLGARGPLVLCEAVRARQPIPVLVLVDATVPPEALADHQSRALPGVRYLDVRQVQAPPEQLVWTIGATIRATVLDMLQVFEDPQTAQTWPQAVQVPKAEPQAEELGEVLPDLDLPDEEARPAPSMPLPVTDDDLRFAATLADRLRGIDFRKTSTGPVAIAASDSAEAKMQKFRDQLREAERRLARLAHVYGSRKHTLDDAATMVASARADRAAAENRANQLAEEGARLKARVAELESATQALQGNVSTVGGEAGRLQALLEAERQARTSYETSVKQVLSQAQEAFNALRDQSTAALGQRDQMLRQRDVDLEQVRRESLELEQAVTQLQQEQAALRQEYDTATARWRDEAAGLTNQLVGLAGERDAARAQAEQDKQTAEARQKEIDTLQATLASERQTAQATISKLQAEAAAQTGALSDKASDLKQAAATFRDHFEQGQEQLVGTEKELAVAQATLQERQEAMTHLEAANRELSKQLERQSKLLDKLTGELSDNKVALAKLGDKIATPAAAPDAYSSESGDGSTAAAGSPWRSAIVLGGQAIELRWLLAVGGVALLAFGLVFGSVLSSGDDVDAAAESAAEIADAAPGAEGAAPAPAAAPEPAAEAPAAAAKPTAAPEAEAKADAAPELAVEPVAKPAEADTEKTEAEAAAAKPAAKAAAPIDRKAVRRAMFEAIGKKRWDAAAEAGGQLRDADVLDWEASWRLGGVFEKVDRQKEALAAYQSFVEEFADNAYADDAFLRIGTLLLAAGKKTEAKAALEKARDFPKGSVNKEAAALLSKIK